MTDLVVIADTGARRPLPAEGQYVHLGSEFQRWAVRWADEREERPVMVRLGAELVTLPKGADGAHRLSKRQAKKIDGATAGIVRFFTSRQAGGDVTELSPTLVIEPTLPRELHRALIRDLRRLAFGLSTCEVYRWRPGEHAAPGAVASTHLQRLIDRATDLAKVCTALRQQLPLMERAQLDEVDRAVATVGRSEVTRRGLRVVGAPRAAHRATVLVPVVRENDHERRFVDTMLRDLHTEVAAMVEGLTAEVGALRTWLPDELLLERIDLGRPLAVPAIAQVLAGLSIDAPPPAEVTAPVYAPTNRLLMSLEFGPLVQAWSAYLAAWPGASSESRSLAQVLSLETVLPTNKLYERWVLLSLVSGLLDLGFVADGPTLIDDLEVVAGEISLRGRSWTYRRPDGMTVVVQSEPPIRTRDGAKDLTPDIVLDVTGVPVGSRRFVIDAKYRDHVRMDELVRRYELDPTAFELPPYQYDEVTRYDRSYFKLDWQGTIEHKYLLLPGVDAGLIGHSDVRAEFEFWDDSLSRRSRGVGPVASPHRAMSVRLPPGVEWIGLQKLKLFSCLFGFHCGATDICWQCGTKSVAQDEEVHRQVAGRRAVGTAYLCPNCHLFWIETWCYQNKSKHHPLLKYGRRSFEQISDDNPYNVACPWCAATLGASATKDYHPVPAGEVAEAGDVDEPF